MRPTPGPAGLLVAATADAGENPGYVEITPSGVDKARGVEEAVHRAGLSMAEIVACGDGENDVTLLERAGYGIAMGIQASGCVALRARLLEATTTIHFPWR
jgi:hydroxymethylpyrimidine pyrophosphatase-like HAD family hydrolase